MATPFLKRKSGKVLIIVLGAGALAYALHGWTDLRGVTHTRAVDRDLKAAFDASRSQPPGIAQFEDLLARIKRIDPGNAPDAVKAALADYIAALEADIKAFKAGEDLTMHDRELDAAQKKLVAAVAKHWY